MLDRADHHANFESKADEVEHVAVEVLLVWLRVERAAKRPVVLESVQAHWYLPVGHDFMESLSDPAHQEAFVSLVLKQTER